MVKKALVTGASEGIGAALAKKLAQEGYQITGVASSEAKLKTLVQELGGGHTYLVADLSTETGQNQITAHISTNHYDLLVNNAGIGTVGAFTDVPVEKYIAMMHLNCDAVVRLSHAFLKSAKSGDALVNVSSTLAFIPMPGIGLYSATKSLVTAFTESLWYEQKTRGVYVLGLHPGITSTNFQTNAGGRKEDLPSALSQTPEQVADVVIKALRSRKKPTIISGAKNVVFAAMSRIMTRKATVSMMGNRMRH